MRKVQSLSRAVQRALTEYQVLEEAVGRNNRYAYMVAGIFVGGTFSASAILIPKLAQQGCGPHVAGYHVASITVVASLWFWFLGIHLRWRANNVIMYDRLRELEEELKFLGAHRRIDDFYKSQKSGFKWPNGEPPPWYDRVMETLRPLTPLAPNINTWWLLIVSLISLPHFITWLFAIGRLVAACPCTKSLLQCVLGSTA